MHKVKHKKINQTRIRSIVFWDNLLKLLLHYINALHKFTFSLTRGLYDRDDTSRMTIKKNQAIKIHIQNHICERIECTFYTQSTDVLHLSQSCLVIPNVLKSEVQIFLALKSGGNNFPGLSRTLNLNFHDFPGTKWFTRTFQVLEC